MPVPSPTPRPSPPPLPTRNGGRILTEWESYRPRERLRMARAAARALHGRLRAGGRLDIDVRDFGFQLHPLGCSAEAWPPAQGARPPCPVHAVLAWLAETWNTLPLAVEDREGLCFLRTLLRLEGVPASLHPLYFDWIARHGARHRHRHARLLSEQARREVLIQTDGQAGASRWDGGPPLADLRARVEAALRHPSTQILKRSPESVVARVDWEGVPVLVKTYPVHGWMERFKDRWRAPRALRAWTAARVFEQIGLPAPRPLAILLGTRLEGARCHLFVSEAIGEAITARQWIKPRLHTKPGEFRLKVARQLLRFFLDMERHGVIHGDTKASNLLVRLGPDGLARRHWWIDLEAVRFDHPPSRRLLLRNLIQLNGSIGRRLPRADRLAFLADYARTHPWAAAPGLAEDIERVTAIRLGREKRRECGS